MRNQNWVGVCVCLLKSVRGIEGSGWWAWARAHIAPHQTIILQRWKWIISIFHLNISRENLFFVALILNALIETRFLVVSLFSVRERESARPRPIQKYERFHFSNVRHREKCTTTKSWPTKWWLPKHTVCCMQFDVLKEINKQSETQQQQQKKSAAAAEASTITAHALRNAVLLNGLFKLLRQMHCVSFASERIVIICWDEKWFAIAILWMNRRGWQR